MNKYFTKRGIKKTVIDFDNEKLDIEVKIPTNREHNELMEKYTNFSIDGTADIKIAEMAEAQMIKCIINLPFEVPIDSEFQNYKEWIHCNDDEKKIAINCMDSKLHDAISSSIVTTDKLSEEESGN